MTGTLKNTNDAALIRIIGTADKFTVGPKIMCEILGWKLESNLLVVEMGNGPQKNVLCMV